ncbi:hypothetical protein CASFOL_023680 [Castilleja foliolosa]|uniref:Uncharacterized protein n=1 Tax=Castilleja foliolosa TaxID=1961234 RepID=A0ABD3CL78_9LAMI
MVSKSTLINATITDETVSAEAVFFDESMQMILNISCKDMVLESFSCSLAKGCTFKLLSTTSPTLQEVPTSNQQRQLPEHLHSVRQRHSQNQTLQNGSFYKLQMQVPRRDRGMHNLLTDN